VAEAFHGEASLELKNAELGRAAARALVNFGINQAIEERWRPESTRMDIDSEPDTSTNELKEEWKSIQDYGEFLKESTNTFRQSNPFALESPDPRRTIPSTPQTSRPSNESDDISPFDWISWGNFRFTTEFAHLAPLTSRDNRIYATQSSKLINWIRDWGNDALFGSWQGLDQVVDSARQPEETRRYRESMEKAALEHILEVEPLPDRSNRGAIREELGYRPHMDSYSENTRSTFARYLSQDAPQPLDGPEHLVTSTGPSRSSSYSLGGTDDDTRSIVSQDNHWRRTIFG
jgi:hypothetical protein